MNNWTWLVPLILTVGCAHSAPPASASAAARVPLRGPQLASAAPLRPSAPRATAVAPAECGMVGVHFAFDSSDIGDADRDRLDGSGKCLREDHGLHAVISGNADERGTEEYNLALGDRRARVVARYLEAEGATPAQLEVISYGEENPTCIAHDESCWSANRRAVVDPTRATLPR
jgi:peptidoglycan-associated lipoprotein